MADLTPPRSDRRPGAHSGQKSDPSSHARAVPIYATTSYVFDAAASPARLSGPRSREHLHADHELRRRTCSSSASLRSGRRGGAGASLRARPPRRSRSSTSRAGDNIVRSSSLYGGTCRPVHPHPGADRHHDDVRGRSRSVGASAARSTRRMKAVLPRADRQLRLDVGSELASIADVPTPGCAGHRRQHLRLLSPTDQARRRHRHRLGDEMDRWPRHRDRRRGVDAGTFDWAASEGSQDFVVHDPRTTASATPAPSATSRSSSSCGFRACATSAGTQPVQRAPLPPGPRDPSAADHAAQRERFAVARVARARRRGAPVQLPGMDATSVLQAGHEVPDRRLRAGRHVRGQGWRRGGRRLIDNVQISPARERRRRETLIIHDPASTMTHSQRLPEEQADRTGVTDDLIRLSVGLSTSTT